MKVFHERFVLFFLSRILYDKRRIFFETKEDISWPFGGCGEKQTTWGEHNSNRERENSHSEKEGERNSKMTLQEVAVKINLDLERTFSLFMGKEDLYVKYLRKFPDNARKILVELEEAVQSGDQQKIEAGAHALKGVSANLGVQSVTDSSAALMLDVRENTPEKIPQHYVQLTEGVKLAMECIEALH